MWNYDYKVPEGKKVRYIIHTDCKNEADDQFTVLHALMTDKLDIRGIIAGHFDKANYNRFPEHTTANASYKEIETILNLAGMPVEKYPVYLGSNFPLEEESKPIETEAARMIIEEAMKEDDRPLYIGMQGAITELACALLLEPRIARRITCIWIGGGDYPEGGHEFNLFQDILAARIVFQSNMPLWQIPRNVYKQFAVSLAELQLKVKPCGDIGRYLYEQMLEVNHSFFPDGNWPHGETWALGDEGCVCALLEEAERDDGYDMIEAPFIMDDMTYSFGYGNRKIRVYHKMDVRLDLEDLFAKFQLNFM